VLIPLCSPIGSGSHENMAASIIIIQYQCYHLCDHNVHAVYLAQMV